MADKTVAVSFRVSKQFKDLLKVAAERERRSQANLIEVLLLDYCAKHGITVGDSGARSIR
jgi:predicted phosphoadenosine phosphosulfate sulfurtransferase